MHQLLVRIHEWGICEIASQGPCGEPQGEPRLAGGAGVGPLNVTAFVTSSGMLRFSQEKINS